MTATPIYPIHPAAGPAAILMGVFRHVDDGPLPPALAALPREEFERRAIRAGLKLLAIRQDELADRLGLNEAVLSRKLTGARASTNLERHLMAVALFVEDRAEMEKIQARCAGHDDLTDIDLAWLAPVADAGAGGR